MKNVKRLKWIASFDMEDLTSSLLRNGMLLSIGLILISLIVGGSNEPQADPAAQLRARSISHLVVASFRQIGFPGFWARAFLNLGVAALFLTPYVRVFASMCYFTWVERSFKHAVLTGFVLLVLTIILLTSWV